MADVGNFTYNIARRSQKGGITTQSNNGIIRKTATDTYTVVIADGKHPNEVTLTGLPAIGDAWDLDNTLFCTEISWNNEFPSEVWTANVVYGLPDSGGSEPGEDSSVVVELIDYGFSSWQADVEQDFASGHAIVNAAQERFQDAIVAERYAPTITVKRKEKNAPTAKLAMTGTINNAATTIAGISIPLHCGQITVAASQREGDSAYPWDVTYQITIMHLPKPDGTVLTWNNGGLIPVNNSIEDFGWDRVVANTGYSYIADDVIKVIQVKDENGRPQRPTDPQMLDTNGGVVGRNSSGKLLGAYWIAYQVYPSANWSSLHLP